MMHIKYRHSFTFFLVMLVAWVLGTFAFTQFSLQPIVNNLQQLFTYLLIIIVVWVLGTFALIYFWPRLMLLGIKRLVTRRGVDANSSSGVPVNTLYAVPNRASPQGTSKIMTTGTDDVLYVFGWLDLSKGPQVLHVPDFSGRYYSVQFTNASDGADFAYVGTRTTGTQTGDYLITGPGWTGQMPSGMRQISSPTNSVLVIGRVLVKSDSDVSAAYGLSKQIQLTPLGSWQPSQYHMDIDMRFVVRGIGSDITQRGPDRWDWPRFMMIFLVSGLYGSQALSPSAHLQVKQTDLQCRTSFRSRSLSAKSRSSNES